MFKWWRHVIQHDRHGNSWFHRPSILFQISFGTQVTSFYITWLPQPMEIRPVTTRPSSHVLAASIKIQNKSLFCTCKHTCIVCEVRISCKGHLVTFFMSFLTSKANFMNFQTVPVLVYILSTLHHWYHWLSWYHWLFRCSCKHFIIWRMIQNLAKNITGRMASNYQVNLAIEIPNIT